MESVVVALVENQIVTGLCLFLLILIPIEVFSILIKARSGPLLWVDLFLTTLLKVSNRRLRRTYNALRGLFRKSE